MGDGFAQASVRGRWLALSRGDRASAGAPLLARGDRGGDRAALLPALEPALPEALLLPLLLLPPLLREVVLARRELLELLRRGVLQRGERHDLRHDLRALRLRHKG